MNLDLSRLMRCVSFSGLNLMGETSDSELATSDADMPYPMPMWPDRSGAMVSDGVAQPSVNVNAYMQQSLAKANAEGRLIGGFKFVMNAIENQDHSLLFCVLPENLWNNQMHRALFSLLVSACHSHGIRMIKVDHDQLVRKIVEMSTEPGSKLPDLSYECLAILSSADPPACDRELLRFHQRHPGGDFDQLPIVNLLEAS